MALARVSSTGIHLTRYLFEWTHRIDLISSPESLPLYVIDRSITDTVETMDTAL